MEKVVVVGSSNVDTVIRVPHIPAPGETLLSLGLDICYGGKGANQAAAIARLGGDIAMIGCVGADSFGDAMLSNLAGFGVNTDGIERAASEQSGAAYIYVSDDGENNIVVHPGANGCLTREVLMRQKHLLTGVRYCIIQLEIPLDTLYYLAELCREMDIRLILNPAPAAKLDFTKLAGSWMIAPNQGELDLLVPGDDNTLSKARTLYQKGFGHVLVTLGAQGCLLINADGERQFPAFETRVKDTTAAGDCFIGALTYSLSRGHELAGAITFANKAASIAVSRTGAQPSLPTLAEIEGVFGLL
ncbi:MAG: ribokinase [Oscillospiraceae bacterium]|nr:ribokinase [Oscillospiraceae bacterium]